MTIDFIEKFNELALNYNEIRFASITHFADDHISIGYHYEKHHDQKRLLSLLNKYADEVFPKFEDIYRRSFSAHRIFITDGETPLIPAPIFANSYLREIRDINRLWFERSTFRWSLVSWAICRETSPNRQSALVGLDILLPTEDDALLYKRCSPGIELGFEP